MPTIAYPYISKLVVVYNNSIVYTSEATMETVSHTSGPPLNQTNSENYTITASVRSLQYINTFTTICNTSHKNCISETVSPHTIKSSLDAVNLDTVLGPSSAPVYFQQVYGYREWLLAPEDGVRGLLRESLLLYKEPLKEKLEGVYEAIIAAVRAAGDKMKEEEREKRNADRKKGIVRAAEDNLDELMIDTAIQTISSWRDATAVQLMTNLHAEAEFPSRDSFERLRRRLDELMHASQMKKKQAIVEEYKRLLALSLRELYGNNSNAPESKDLSIVTPITNKAPAWSEFYMGWLQKRSRRGIWQRRWVVLSVRLQRAWWYGHPEEEFARGTIDIKGGRVIDVHEGLQDGGAFEILVAEAAGPFSSGAEFLGPRTKKNVVSLTLKAPSIGGKKQWMEMVDKGIQGLTAAELEAIEAAEKLERAKLDSASFSPGAGENDHENKVERKISTKVFPDEKKPIDKKNTAVGASTDSEASSSSAASSTTSEETDEELEESEEQRIAREQALFDEIAQQAQQVSPSQDDLAVLECVIKAVKEYLTESVLIHLTEQASKVIADGMLPMGRETVLHGDLLKGMLTAMSTATGVASGSRAD